MVCYIYEFKWERSHGEVCYSRYLTFILDGVHVRLLLEMIKEIFVRPNEIKSKGNEDHHALLMKETTVTIHWVYVIYLEPFLLILGIKLQTIDI
jgi:hypothetical protein